MDFLDPKKRRKRTIQLFVGYTLVGIAIVVATVILMYQAYGFGLDKNGQVIQNGLVYVSSQPGNATILLNGVQKGTTNTRFNIPAGQYNMSIQRTGYRTWNRTITVEGGNVVHYDYPFLFPVKLTTTTQQTYIAAPALATESPDRRWLLISQTISPSVSFQLTDISKTKPVTTTVSLPDGLVTVGQNDTWKLVEWSDDNRHVLLSHTTGAETDYVLVDRQTPDQSVNLTKLLGSGASSVKLLNKQYDSYMIYNPADKSLSQANLKDHTLKPYLNGVEAFQTYGTNTVLYATTTGTDVGKARILLKQGNTTYTIRTVPSGSQYLLDLTQYSGDLYVAAGVASEDRVYVYDDPVSSLQANPQQVLVPVSVLKVNEPNYIAFSSNARFIVAENGTSFAVYDAENDKTYTYTAAAPLDAPQPNAHWMDGHRLSYISNGKLEVFDFDDMNPQSLMTANANYLPFFDGGYKYVYSLMTSQDGKTVLQSTPLQTPADL